MSVTFAQGFLAAGQSGGLKSSEAKDVALVVNIGPQADAAGVFTTNRFAAAPVLWSQQVLGDREARVVLLNSGGANACTGPEGFQDTHGSAELCARLLSDAGFINCSAGDVVVCSTGLIGERLNMAALAHGLNLCVESLTMTGGGDAAVAIMTTDTVPKVATHEINGFRIGGMAKGAGMLAPGMATMLSVITTDALIGPDPLARILRECTQATFDRLDSDGCMSTNDSVILLANGASGVKPDEVEFREALYVVCDQLARSLMSDAEGATKEIEICVVGAVSDHDAVDVGRAVSRSNLFKCAMFGEDPNWGRILSAVGTTQADFDPMRVNVSINGVVVSRNGGVGDDRDSVDLSGRKVTVSIDLGAGGHSATILTNDLSVGYVHENSAYSS
jgi:glutamate N-acetyltransferase/amino-acid N-acetyltransferase